jgi:hypothetical protein
MRIGSVHQAQSGRPYRFLRWDEDRGNSTIISHHSNKIYWGDCTVFGTEWVIQNKGRGTATFLRVKYPVKTYLAIFRSGCYARHPLLDPWILGGRGPPSLPLTWGYSHTGIQTWLLRVYAQTTCNQENLAFCFQLCTVTHFVGFLLCLGFLVPWFSSLTAESDLADFLCYVCRGSRPSFWQCKTFEAICVSPPPSLPFLPPPPPHKRKL